MNSKSWDSDYARARTAARKAANSKSGVGVEVIDGSAEAPVYVEGRDGWWTTPSGLTRVYHPSAYSKKGRVVYHCQTHKVVVGELWLEAHKKRGAA